jgi:hypothetical protein
MRCSPALTNSSILLGQFLGVSLNQRMGISYNSIVNKKVIRQKELAGVGRREIVLIPKSDGVLQKKAS